MLQSIILASLAICNVYGAVNFEYPEVGESWAQVEVLGEGVPNYCGSEFKYQTPININTCPSASQKCPTYKPLSFNPVRDINTFHVKNTGYTLQIVPVCCGIDEAEIDETETAGVLSGRQFGVLKDNFAYIGDDDFCLDSFHLHWGQTDTTGSEHTFNNQQSLMELHFVHYKCKYESVGNALQIFNDEFPEKNKPTLAVVGVLFEEGADNPFIQQIVNRIKELETPTHTGIEFTSIHDMFDVLPTKNDEIIGNYYHYKGGLTTPPCTPAVSWHVLDTKMTVGASQMDAIRSVLDNENTIYENYRGVKVNLNPIFKCPVQTQGCRNSYHSKY